MELLVRGGRETTGYELERGPICGRAGDGLEFAEPRSDEEVSWLGGRLFAEESETHLPQAAVPWLLSDRPGQGLGISVGGAPKRRLESSPIHTRATARPGRHLCIDQGKATRQESRKCVPDAELENHLL